MTLCNACKVLAKELFKKSTYQRSLHDGNRHRYYTRKTRHLSSIKDILASAENCTFCALIRIGLEMYKSDGTDTDQDTFAASLGSHLNEPLVVHATGDSITHQNPNSLSLHHLGFEIPKGPFNTKFLSFKVWGSKDSPAFLSGDVDDVPPLDDDSSDEAFSLIRRRLSWCLASHNGCKMTMSETMIDESVGQLLPTRVIDVSYWEPRLLTTEAKRGHYIALSHCWGPEEKRPLRTTTGNLQKHISGIPFIELPKTFQDAIRICREIGFQYLWIDSLCILQDSEEDWMRESKKMGSIYERARLTIAASGAKDPSEGCFGPIRPKSTPIIELPYFPDSGVQTGSFLISLKMVDHEYLDPALGPLRLRAWAAQEWKLSRRMIHYMPHGISWKCKFIDDAIDDSGTRYDIGNYSGWCAFVTYYTECELTKESDRLIALQGIANEMQKARQDRYCLGLWSGELPQQLLWMGDKLKKNEDLLDIPSWTWASKKGAVSFPCIDIYGKFESVCDEIIIWHSRELRVRGFTKYGTCGFAGSTISLPEDTDEDKDDDLEEDSGSILGENLDQAKAFLSLFDLTRLYRIKDLDEQYKEHVGLAVFDNIDYIPTGFCCLSLMKGRRNIGDCNHSYGYFVLLLERLSLGDELYQRIGIGIITLDSWLHRAVSSYVTII